MKRSIVLAGQTSQLQPLITQLMAFYQLLEGLDIGEGGGSEPKPYYPERENKPLVELFFLEDTSFQPGVKSSQSTLPGTKPNSIYRRTEGRISFRIMEEESHTFSSANATSIANKIKQVFGANNGFVWQKGKEMYSYTRWEQGYQLQLLCKSKVHAKSIVTNVLSIQNHTPSWKWFNSIENEAPFERYPAVPPKITTLGQTVETPRSRPVVDVRFQYALLRLGGLPQSITLYDRTGKRPFAMVT